MQIGTGCYYADGCGLNAARKLFDGIFVRVGGGPGGAMQIDKGSELQKLLGGEEIYSSPLESLTDRASCSTVFFIVLADNDLVKMQPPVSYPETGQESSSESETQTRKIPASLLVPCSGAHLRIFSPQAPYPCLMNHADVEKLNL